MKATSLIRVAAVAAVSAVCAFGIAACSGSGESAGTGDASIAATVSIDGEQVGQVAEQTVTDYIQTFRAAQGLEDEHDWGNWLADNDLDPESVRSEVIEYYTNNILKEHECEVRDITVTDEEVDEQVAQMRSYYSDDEAWADALAAAGTTEEQYRESVRMAMLESQLRDVITEEQTKEVTDDDILQMVQQYASGFDGAKRSSHILFSADDEQLAQEVLDRINYEGLDFAEAATEYSTDTGSAANGGDVGWDKLNTFVTEYTDGLDPLGEGEVSGLVPSTYGIHIIKCTAVYHAPEDSSTITSVDQVPSELVDYVRNIAESNNETNAYTDWFNEYKDAAEIVINDMPEGLPYWVDVDEFAGEANEQDGLDADGNPIETTDDGTVDVSELEGETTVTTEDGTTVSTDEVTVVEDTAEGEGDAGAAEQPAEGDAAEGEPAEQPAEGEGQ